MQSIYYNDHDNTFEDDFGCVFYNISELLPNDKIIKYKRIGGTYYSSMNGKTIEIDFPIRDEERLIIYSQEDNSFTDEDDNLVFNIFNIITTMDLLLFKSNKVSAYIRGIQGELIEFLYL